MIRRLADNSAQSISKALDERPQLKKATQQTVTVLNSIYSAFSVIFVISVLCASLLWTFEQPVVVKDLVISNSSRTVLNVDRGAVKMMDLIEFDTNQRASYAAELLDIKTGELIMTFPRYILPRGKELKRVPIYFPEWLPKGRYIFQSEMKIRINPIKNSKIELEPVVIEIN